MTNKVSRETKSDKQHIELYMDVSSTNTGVARYEVATGCVTLDSINLTKFKKPQNMSQVDYEKIKMIGIRNYLDKLQKDFQIDFVCLEGIFIQPKFLKSSEVLLKIHGFLMGYFMDTRIYYQAPSLIKQKITGKGNAGKDEVRNRLEEVYHYPFRNHDESDAFALLVSFRGEEEYRIGQEKEETYND